MKIYELNPRYDTRKSFYGKAKVVESENGLTLFSYDTEVARIKNDVFIKCWNGYSVTTMRHINEFRKQNDFSKLSKKEWEKL